MYIYYIFFLEKKKLIFSLQIWILAETIHALINLTSKIRMEIDSGLLNLVNFLNPFDIVHHHIIEKTAI